MKKSKHPAAAPKFSKPKVQAAPPSSPARKKHNSTLRPAVKTALKKYCKKNFITESFVTEKAVVLYLNMQGVKVK